MNKSRRMAALQARALSRSGISVLQFRQPVISGKQHLQQFLRLRVAGEMMGCAGAERTGTSALRAKLEGGATLDIAGYTVSPSVSSRWTCASRAEACWSC
jgi:hypothetical protein